MNRNRSPRKEWVSTISVPSETPLPKVPPPGVPPPKVPTPKIPSVKVPPHKTSLPNVHHPPQRLTLEVVRWCGKEKGVFGVRVRGRSNEGWLVIMGWEIVTIWCQRVCRVEQREGVYGSRWVECMNRRCKGRSPSRSPEQGPGPKPRKSILEGCASRRR